MATALLTVLLTFLLTGLVANRLAQAWQHRNWISQQRLSDTQKEYEVAQSVFDEMAALASRRHYRMVRLLMAIRSLDIEQTKQRLAEYDSSLVEWNERLNAIYAKLTIYLLHSFTRRLEEDVQKAFYALGRDLEHLANQKLAAQPIDPIRCRHLQRSLDTVKGRLTTLNRDILKFNLERKNALFKECPFNDETLDRFPTWELFKALFKPRVDS